MRKLVGIGHSHLHPITAALKEFEKKHPETISYTAMCLVDAPYAPSFTIEKGVLIPNPIWIEEMRKHISGPDVDVFLCLGGSEHWRISLTPGPQPFDFVDPVQDDGLPLIGQLVPYDLVMRHLGLKFRFLSEHVSAIRDVALTPLIQFLPPPPVFDLMAAIEPKNKEQFMGVLESFPVSPPSFRRKVWRACARAASEVCANIGVECVPPPAESYDSNDFLRDDLISDTVHGNIAWGRLHLRRILGDRCESEAPA